MCSVRRVGILPRTDAGTGERVEDLFTYPPGIPRYLALWLPLTPVMVVGLRAAGTRWTTIGAVVAATLPTFVLHVPSAPPGPQVLRYLLLVGAEIAVLLWLVQQVRRPPAATPPGDDPYPVWWAVGLVVVALVVRVPLAWADPGISDIPTSTEVAATQLLDGTNPYTVENPETYLGRYQYPAGTLLTHAPFVWAAPDTVGGEEHIGVRTAIWTTEVLAVLLLLWAGTRLASRRAGMVAAFAYAVHPTLVRDAGMVVANDLLVGLFVAGSGLMFTRRRSTAAGLLLGLAIAVKPSAGVLLPLLLVAEGPRSVAWAVGVPAVLQTPFLLWPRPGLHGVHAMLEPAARVDAFGVLRSSAWWPWYAATDGRGWSVTVAAVVGLAVALGVAAWVGRRLRAERPPAAVLAGFAAPLTAAFLLASVQRINYGDWALTSMLLAVGLGTAAAVSRRRPPERSTPRPRH